MAEAIKESKELVIKWISSSSDKAHARLECGIDEVRAGKKSSTVSKTISISFQKEYANYLVHEKCDAFLVGLLSYASKNGFDIRSQVPVSKDVYYDVAEHLIPMLVRDGHHAVKLSMDVAPSVPLGCSVSMGFHSVGDVAGVVGRYAESGADYRPTHVCIVNPGKKMASEARKAADGRGMSLVEADTDIGDAFQCDPVYQTIFALLCTRRLWRLCYALDEPHIEKTPSRDRLIGNSLMVRPLALGSLSTSGFEFFVEPSAPASVKEAEPSGELWIKWIRKEDSGDESRLVCGIDEVDVDGNATASKEVVFKVSPAYSDYLVSERCDAFVAGLIPYASENNLTIKSAVPISEDVFHRVTEYLIPLFDKDGKRRVRVEAHVASSLPSGKGVGACLSCDVDSLYVVNKYKGYRFKNYSLTHICVNIGASRSSSSPVGKAASETGLPIIETDSNIVELFKCGCVSSNTIRSAFETLCLKKLWKRYYFPSGWAVCDPDPKSGGSSLENSGDESLLYTSLSTPGLRLVADSSAVNHVEKMRGIARSTIARRYLHSCSSEKTCSRCSKCTRDLLALDVIGKLKEFAGIYDVDFYKKNRSRYIRYLYNNRSDPSFDPIFKILHDGGDAELLKVEKVMDSVKRFDILWKRGTRASDKRAAELLMPYETEDFRAALRMAKAYGSGRGVPVDIGKRDACIDVVVDHYKEEISEGFATSRIKLFDVLWNLDDPKRYGEMISVLKPSLEAEKPQACVRMAFACMEGKGVKKDPEAAVGWMKKSPESRGKLLKEYCGMLLATDDADHHAEAYDLCMGEYEKSKDPEFCVLLSRMYADGKGVKKDHEASLEWMRKAYVEAPEIYHMQLLDLLDESGSVYDYYEYVEVGFDMYDKFRSADACAALSDAYRQGKGMNPNPDAAVGWM